MSDGPSTIAIYPGSFDPVTLGHEDIARRCLKITDELIVAVAHTATETKTPLFSVEERLALMTEVFSSEPRIRVSSFQGLLVDYAREVGADFVLRGLRAVSDFEYEFQMAQMNRELHSELETVFLTPEHDFAFLSASLVRQVASLGGDVSGFVSPAVLQKMQERLAR